MLNLLNRLLRPFGFVIQRRVVLPASGTYVFEVPDAATKVVITSLGSGGAGGEIMRDGKLKDSDGNFTRKPRVISTRTNYPTHSIMIIPSAPSPPAAF